MRAKQTGAFGIVQCEDSNQRLFYCYSDEYFKLGYGLSGILNKLVTNEKSDHISYYPTIS